MAITFPLSLADFWDLLIINVESDDGFRLDRNDEISIQGGGGVLSKNLGPPLWSVTPQSGRMPHENLTRIRAIIEMLEDTRQTFYCYDVVHNYPQYDPTGAILGASTVQINSIPDNVHLTLKGLPVGYVITVGDMISYTFLSASRTALVRAQETVTANGSGITPSFQVSPSLRPGIAANDAVSLKKPQMKALIVPGSVGYGRADLFTTLSFKALQYMG